MDALGTQHLWEPCTKPPAGPRGLAWADAQAAVNFVLFRPDPLPGGFRVEGAAVQPERPPTGDEPASHRALHRAEIVGRGARILLRQFLHDWAPPAWDHPSLAGSEARAFIVGGHIGWLGRHYRGFPAATVTLDRTTIEMSVTEGAVPDELLAELCHALRPVSEEARDRILRTPFARLAYRSRHGDRTAPVPVGFFRHRRGPPDVAVHAYDEPPAGLLGRHLVPPARLGLRLAGAFVFGDPRRPQEVEYLYEDAADPGRTLRLLVSPAGVAHGVPYPPALEGQPCAAERRELEGREVHHAYADPRYGPHEAVWHAGGLNVMLLAKAAPWTDRFWFGRVLSEMAAID
jgi:hypothetical protein